MDEAYKEVKSMRILLHMSHNLPIILHIMDSFPGWYKQMDIRHVFCCKDRLYAFLALFSTFHQGTIMLMYHKEVSNHFVKRSYWSASQSPETTRNRIRKEKADDKNVDSGVGGCVCARAHICNKERRLVRYTVTDCLAVRHKRREGKGFVGSDQPGELLGKSTRSADGFCSSDQNLSTI